MAHDPAASKAIPLASLALLLLLAHGASVGFEAKPMALKTPP
jgi:hypothetical protein